MFGRTITGHNCGNLLGRHWPMLDLSGRHYTMASLAHAPTTKHVSFNLQDIEKMARINKVECCKSKFTY